MEKNHTVSEEGTDTARKNEDSMGVYPSCDRSEESKVPAFKAAFKYYKAKRPQPDLNNVIDVTSPRFSNVTRELDLQNVSIVDPSSMVDFFHLGLNQPCQWKGFEFVSHPGLYIIKNVLSRTGEYLWTKRSLIDYSGAPNRTNIDHILSGAQSRVASAQSSHDSLLDDPVLSRKLRWLTLGYHHNWETKRYSEDNRSPMPEEMSRICQIAANVFGFKFVAEAAIIHFYHHDSTLSGHVDCSELNLDAPLLAFSIGQSGIFLIGGPTLDEAPTPLWLRSGDLMLMTDPSRTCYHGIPKIILDQTFLAQDGESRKIVKYMNENRINLNVRQVNFVDEDL